MFKELITEAKKVSEYKKMSKEGNQSNIFRDYNLKDKQGQNMDDFIECGRLEIIPKCPICDKGLQTP